MQKVYSVRDSKADIYNTPFFQQTHGEAERTFRKLVQDPQTLLSQFPDDFDLYYVGEFDSDKGIIKALDTPQHVIKAINCVNPAQVPSSKETKQKN